MIHTNPSDAANANLYKRISVCPGSNCSLSKFFFILLSKSAFLINKIVLILITDLILPSEESFYPRKHILMLSSSALKVFPKLSPCDIILPPNFVAL